LLETLIVRKTGWSCWSRRPRLEGRRSIQLSYGRTSCVDSKSFTAGDDTVLDALILCRSGRRSMKLSCGPILCYSFDSTKVEKPIRPPTLPESWSSLACGTGGTVKPTPIDCACAKRRPSFQSKREYVTDLVSGACPIQKWLVTSLAISSPRTPFRDFRVADNTGVDRVRPIIPRTTLLIAVKWSEVVPSTAHPLCPR
jgi:hypothetical protein